MCCNRGWTDPNSWQRTKCLWAKGLCVHCDPETQQHSVQMVCVTPALQGVVFTAWSQSWLGSMGRMGNNPLPVQVYLKGPHRRRGLSLAIHGKCEFEDTPW